MRVLALLGFASRVDAPLHRWHIPAPAPHPPFGGVNFGAFP
jgi:hypothetical protein